MSLDKNILKSLFDQILEKRLHNLEKRNIQQMKDLNFSKIAYKKQEETLNKLSKIKIKKKFIKKKSFDTFKKSIKSYKGRFESSKFKSPGRIQFLNKRNAITPDRTKTRISPMKNIVNDNVNKWNKHNNKYNYIKSRYKDEFKIKIDKNNKKLFVTPEPKLKKKKKIIKNHIEINIEPKKLNLENTKMNKNEKEIRTRNIKTIKREEDNKKNLIVSSIDLDVDLMECILEDKRKEDKKREYIDSINNNENEENSSIENNNSSSSINYNNKTYTIKDKEIVNKFGKYLISNDGNEIVSLLCSFLDKKSKINFLTISKKLIRPLTYYLDDLYTNILKMNKIEISNTIESQINNIKNKYGEDVLNSPRHAFTLSKGSSKALDLLNADKYNNIFRKKKLDPPLNEIILIYRIFFQLIDKEEFVVIESDKKFWEKTRNFILENNEGKTGTFLKEYISEFDFTSKNIYKIKKLVYGKEDKLKPLLYENICKTTGLVIFIIKDSLEYCGLLKNEQKNEPNIIINYLEFLKNIIDRAKEYIDVLKEL